MVITLQGSLSVHRQTAGDAGELGIKTDVRDVVLPKVGLDSI